MRPLPQTSAPSSSFSLLRKLDLSLRSSHADLTSIAELHHAQLQSLALRRFRFASMHVRCSSLLGLRLEDCIFADRLSLEGCQGLVNLCLDRIHFDSGDAESLELALATACGLQEVALLSCGTVRMPSAMSHMTRLRRLTVLCALEEVQCALPLSLEYVQLGHWLHEIPQRLELLPNLRRLTLRSHRPAFSVTRPLAPLLMQPLLKRLVLTRVGTSSRGDEWSAEWSPQS
jgi:hypothetical protein